MQTRRLLFPSPGAVELSTAPVAAIGPGTIQCAARTSLVSVGTEVTCLRGRFDPRTFWEEWVQYPFAPGYSMVARVEHVGEGVEAFAPGDRVFAFQPHAARFTIPATDATVIPSSISDDQAAWASLGVTTQWALRRAGFVFGETAVVIGLGLLGQLLVRYLRIAGARRILAIDTDADRLRRAAAGGAHETLQATAADAVAMHGGAFDAAFDVTGHPSVLASASELVRPLGRVVLVGDAPQPRLQALGPRIVADGISIIGVHAGTAAPIATPADPWSTAAMLTVFFAYLADGRLDLAGLITDRILPDEAPDLYRAVERGESAHLGILIDWSSET